MPTLLAHGLCLKRFFCFFFSPIMKLSSWLKYSSIYYLSNLVIIAGASQPPASIIIPSRTWGGGEKLYHFRNPATSLLFRGQGGGYNIFYLCAHLPPPSNLRSLPKPTTERERKRKQKKKKKFPFHVGHTKSGCDGTPGGVVKEILNNGLRGGISMNPSSHPPPPFPFLLPPQQMEKVF